MRRITESFKIFFLFCYWEVGMERTTYAVTGNMVWNFYFVPRKNNIIISYIVISPLMIFLFGVFGFYQVFREILVSKRSPLYNIEKPIGEIPSKIECYKLF